MKAFIVGLVASLMVGVVGLVVGTGIGVGVGVGACGSNPGTSVTTPVPAVPSSTPTSAPAGADLAVSVKTSNPSLHGGDTNTTLWQQIEQEVHNNAHQMVVELVGSWLESKYFDDAIGEGSAGPWQIQLDIAGRNVSLAQAEDPVFSTHWIQQLYKPAFASESAANKALWSTSPAIAAANVASDAESPTLPYTVNRSSDIQPAYEAAVYVMGLLGFDTSSFPDTGSGTASSGTTCGSATGSASSVGSVYHIGDSLSVGMAGEGALQQKYSASGVTVTQIEATTGIGITASIAALKHDAANVKAADAAVVELGTNDYQDPQQVNEAAIDAFLKAMRSINPSIQVYWVNTYSTMLHMQAINDAIAARAKPDRYTVINWQAEATQDQKSKSPKYSFDTEAGIHLSGAGYANMAKFVVSQLPGGSASAIVKSTDAPRYCKDGSAVGAEKIVCSAWLFDDYGYNFGGFRGPASFLKGFLRDIKTCVSNNYGAGCRYPAGTHLVDCSGLVDAAIYDAYGVDMDGASTDSYPSNPNLVEIPMSQAQIGDIVWKPEPDGHTEIIVGNDPAHQTLYTFGAHQVYAEYQQDIGPDTYDYSYFTKTYRVKTLQTAGAAR